MLIKLENGAPAQWPVTEAHLQFTNPDTSFSFPVDEPTLNRFGYATLHFSDPATYDPEWQEPKETTPALLDGKWTQQWEIVEKYTPEERAVKEAEKVTWAAKQYERDRAAAYPSFAEQFDLLYHGGFEVWRAAIQAVKDKYPKP